MGIEEQFVLMMPSVHRHKRDFKQSFKAAFESLDDNKLMNLGQILKTEISSLASSVVTGAASRMDNLAAFRFPRIDGFAAICVDAGIGVKRPAISFSNFFAIGMTRMLRSGGQAEDKSTLEFITRKARVVSWSCES